MKVVLTDFIFTIGYMAEKIQAYFGDGSKWDVNIEYFMEDKPLGNAGALFFLDLKDDFLLLNVDAVFDVDFNRMVDYYKEKGGLVTLFTKAAEDLNIDLRKRRLRNG